MTTVLIITALLFGLLILGGLASLFTSLAGRATRWLNSAAPSEQDLALDRELKACRKARRDLQRAMDRINVD